MTWLNSIYDLQYYKQPKGLPCYCELIVFPSDMYLQGLLYGGNGNYTLKLYVYSADGVAQYEDATSYFDYYFGKMPGGQHYFNARLRAYSPAMCAHDCYIIRAQVTSDNGLTSQVIFDKYTERYCQNDCCDTARNISFEQTGFSPDIIGGDPADPTTADPTGIGIPSDLPASLPTGMCGEPLIRLISKFDCIDNFTGEFFGSPDTIFGGMGTPFEYRKVTTLRGRIVRRPREITRELSYNCRLQRSESTAQYLLEGYEYFPPWKMYEIEGQMHANHIYVDDFNTIKEYQFAGGATFSQVNKCFELFKLQTALEDCTQRQIFGCGTGCDDATNPDGSQLIFAIPATYRGGAFYDEQKQLVANDYDGLLVYFRSKNSVTDVQDVDTSGMSCTVYKVFSVTAGGYIPGSFYYDERTASHRVFGTVVSDIDELCAEVVPQCSQPEQGVFAVEEVICAVPVSGSLSTETITTETVTVNGYGDWVKDSGATGAEVYYNEVRLDIKVDNSEITEDPENPGAPISILNDIIGVVGSGARPAAIAVLDSVNNSTLPVGAVLTIDTNGIIRYTGDVTDSDSSGVTIELTNILYNI